MKVEIHQRNDAFVSLIQDHLQMLPVDANFFIPFDRSKISSKIKPLDMGIYLKIWLKPLFMTFPHLTIHESVYEEATVSLSTKKILDHQITTYDQPIILLDSELNEQEEMVRAAIESKIAKYTNYEPEKDNRDDRGEVKSLAYIATKELLYFCSHDSNALKLIDKAEEWDTNLEGVNAIRVYEIIYFLMRAQAISRERARFLYKYLYYLTTREKTNNPEWGMFIEAMDDLYKDIIDSNTDFPKVTIE